MTLAQKIVSIVRGGGDVRFAQSGDGIQCWVRRADDIETGTSAHNDIEEALNNAHHATYSNQSASENASEVAGEKE